MSGQTPDATPASARHGTQSIKGRLQALVRGVVGPPAALLGRIGMRPDHLTVVGLLWSVAAGLAFFEGAFRWGALLTALGGVCDILDGEMARRLGGGSRFGAFLDSTLDRLAEAVVLVGLAGFYIGHLVELTLDPRLAAEEIGRGLDPAVWERVGLVAVLALVGSFMVSYTRARAEGLGLACRVGWFERPERMVLIIAAAAFGVGPVMPAALIGLTVLSFATAAQRLAHVWKMTRIP
ncbi:MAG: CDP-alcohol phosphatidyltransferase family protein [Candidatus Eisenbacteria bacterium]|uniref:CDP-alcohol phosphatidyltransferase family protein n=1 Tax=Eiseniibacteriota bacterium TaxID=2212470 RepID=A0A538TRG7_UNCEI|nr:MAG: CDP-alcohol phosphatidyltransferase family protein [Candidatus Eisenbacteria bacterium]